MEFDLPELLLDLFFDPSKFLSSNENWANFLLLSHTYQKICGPNMNGVERTKAKFYKMLKVQFVLRLSSLRSRVPNAIWFFWKNKMFWPSAFMAFIVHNPLVQAFIWPSRILWQKPEETRWCITPQSYYFPASSKPLPSPFCKKKNLLFS